MKNKLNGFTLNGFLSTSGWVLLFSIVFIIYLGVIALFTWIGYRLISSTQLYTEYIPESKWKKRIVISLLIITGTILFVLFILSF